MDLQGRKTGPFYVTQTFDVSHEVDGYAARAYREDVVHRQMMDGLQQILLDGRRYEVQVTTTTVLGGQYPPGVPADGAPSLACRHGVPLSQIYSQYTLTCTAILVLVDPNNAEIGEHVRLDAFPVRDERDYRMNLYRTDEPDWMFERVKVGWRRIS